MSQTTDRPSEWPRFQPSSSTPWNAQRIAHFFRRAGFGATWFQVQTARQAGFDETLQMLLAGDVQESADDSKSPGWFEHMSSLLAESATQTQHIVRLKAAWIFRMLYSPDPLAEQLVLMWHNHFATSHLKVDDVQLMWTQNELLRRAARQPFGELLGQVMLDPAMLIWLDADSNRKGSPNENLARELLELFTLGIGHYSEKDVKESARSLTGRTLRNGRGGDDLDGHDAGIKQILGRKGQFTPERLIDLLVSHPATARRLAWRICQHFMGEGIASSEQLASLADGLQARRLDVNWAVTTVLSSEPFFSQAVVGQRVRPPSIYVTSAVRGLAPLKRRASPVLLADWMAELGQDLFYPPNVAGWRGGKAWLSSQRMVARIRFAEALVQGRLSSPIDSRPLDLASWPAYADSRPLNTPNESDVINDLATLLLGRPLRDEQRAVLIGREAEPQTSESRIINLLSMPEAQID